MPERLSFGHFFKKKVVTLQYQNNLIINFTFKFYYGR